MKGAGVISTSAPFFITKEQDTMAEATEVGLRSPDAPDSSEVHKKDFVVPTDEYTLADKATMHLANERKVRADLFSKGMRPTGDISHKAAKDKPFRGSTTITYTVDAVVLDHEVESDILHQDVEGEAPAVGEEDEVAAEEQKKNADAAGNPDESEK